MSNINVPLQLFFNILIISGIYSLVATGYTLIQGILKFINFQHGIIVALGGYTAYFLNTSLGLNLFISAFISFLVGAIIGMTLEYLIYRPLRRKPETTLLMISLGASIILSNLLLIFVGPWIRTYNIEVSKGWNIYGAYITSNEVLILVISVSLLICLHLLTTRTKVGKAMRALSDNLDVAAILGIDANKIISLTFGLSSGLAAFAGVLIGIELNLTPYMGSPIIIKIFTAAVLGGIGHIAGSIFGSFIIASAEVLGSWFFTPYYKDAFSYIILIIVLLVRPQGLFGERQKYE